MLPTSSKPESETSRQVGGFGDPDEGLGDFVVAVDVVADGQNELLQIPEGLSPDAVFRQVTEESLDMLVTLLACVVDHSIGGVKRGEQRGRAVALVIVGYDLAAAFFHRQAWLGAVQSLYLALLIDRKHQRVLGWIEIDADVIFEIGGEFGIVADLESLDAMRLQSVCSPDAPYAGL